MDHNMVDDFDLNLEPLIDPQNGIEDRLRLLEVVTARARQTQRRPSLELVIEPRVRVNGSRKRDISHVAKALEIDIDLNGKNIDAEKVVHDVSNNGNFFDCNICLKMASDPILTICGHLFCWACFYYVPNIDSVSKECPVCKGEVLDSNITPVYGNGDGNGENSQALESDYVMKIPSRPRANRVEGVRQQCFGREVAYTPMSDVIRRLRVGLGIIEENALQSFTNVSPTSGISLRNSVAGESREGHQTSRVMSGSTALTSEDLQTNASNSPEPVHLESVTSVADTPFLHLATLITDGSVEVDQTISRPRRRRGVSRVLRLEGESSAEHRRRRFR